MRQKKRCSLPFRHLILPCHLCRLCQEYPVEDITFGPSASDRWCVLTKFIFSDRHLRAPLWVLVPQNLLWDLFYPVQRCIINHPSVHPSVYILNL